MRQSSAGIQHPRLSAFLLLPPATFIQPAQTPSHLPSRHATPGPQPPHYTSAHNLNQPAIPVPPTIQLLPRRLPTQGPRLPRRLHHPLNHRCRWAVGCRSRQGNRIPPSPNQSQGNRRDSSHLPVDALSPRPVRPRHLAHQPRRHRSRPSRPQRERVSLARTRPLPSTTTKLHKRQWFRGKIHRCHRWAPLSIRG